ncbi:hypothetical protein ACPOL_3248 [Acidisarcina polymorpha]|uniref:Uncharacterized protein n=2 Tax=Acidisarcina polymorpha TaxID=2211140 RepID=A0A2Z5G060_9BACT|nr:hypothetical protein ACPOL_3248 [Acidisarcina polymorpha]
MNFIRAEEPRETIDLMQPVREQMALIKAHKLPATWLLQYDALVEGPYVEFLKKEMPIDHETGIWFEMNRRICDDAGIAWRGNPKWEWDYHVPVAYAIGYTPEERRRLADTAVATYKRVFGRDLKSLASWNLDAVTIAHLSDHYFMDAFGNCRDQLATDGFTIWGAPIAGYYPNRKNAWSPALEEKNQISTPMFRLLGQDPVYYYDKKFPYPDTVEPVWPSGRSEVFIDRFLQMIDESPTQAFAYAQFGQENSFGWAEMQEAYPMQMEKLSRARTGGQVSIETMGESGRRFKQRFKSTPTQAQVMLEDPFGEKAVPERTVWYQSKYHRANLHFRGEQFYLRDLHVYNDQFPQPYLEEPVRKHGIEQRMLAALDGYHWSDDEVRSGRPGKRAMGRFAVVGANGEESFPGMAGLPKISEGSTSLDADVPLSGGGSLRVSFRDRDITFTLVEMPVRSELTLLLEWAPDRAALRSVASNRLNYSFRDFDYAVEVANGNAVKLADGVRIVSNGRGALRLIMAP